MKNDRPVAIVVLTKYREVFYPFLVSVVKYAPSYPLVVVADGSDGGVEFTGFPGTEKLKMNWINGPSKFSMAGNGNLGLKAVPEDHDILYCGDDVRFFQEGTVEKLRDAAYSYPEVGILSPAIVGRGSRAQVNPREFSYVKPFEMWFPCVYIKREVLAKIGFLDEQFNDFGSDDLDFCIRAKLAGFELGVTPEVAVQHEYSPEGGPTTFVKNIGVDEWQKQQGKALEKLQHKYDVSYQTLVRSLNTGDCSLLLKKESNPVESKLIDVSVEPTVGPHSSKEEISKFLQSKHIFIATPAYGGQMSTNYVNSLLGLVNLCHNFRVKYTTSFIYNESLVTRARNMSVGNFLKTDCTDLFFIDADIGFNPNDILTLLFHPEEVIGATCSRKNLRLDRVFEIGKAAGEGKTNGKVYSQDDLEKLCSEFVINFDPKNPPAEFNLGKLVEVRHAGTGLLRIQRQVFDKVAAKFPERRYLPMLGENGEKQVEPLFMYFQAELDPDEEYFVAGLPNYLSEDYSFCRLCNKAGVRTFVAPWIETTHAGYFLFQGSLKAVADAQKYSSNIRLRR